MQLFVRSVILVWHRNPDPTDRNLALIMTITLTITGSGTFRSPVFSLHRAKVPTGKFRSLERKFPGIFGPGNESSQELSFQGGNVPGNIRSTER